MVLQIIYEPKFQRMNPGEVAAILARKTLGIVFLIEVPQVVVRDRLMRQITVEECAELLPARIRPHRQENDSQALGERPRAMRERRERLVRRKALIGPIEAVQIDLAFLIDKTPQEV